MLFSKTLLKSLKFVSQDKLLLCFYSFSCKTFKEGYVERLPSYLLQIQIVSYMLAGQSVTMG